MGLIMETNWSRPMTLKEFPANTQVRLRQLEPNREIEIVTPERGAISKLMVRRVGLNRFQCRLRNGEAAEIARRAQA